MQMALLATANETHKGLLIRWSYKFNMLIEITMLSFIFIGISFFMGNGELRQEMLAPALLGYLVWFYALAAISNMSYALREETQTGTLEQMHLSPTPIGALLIGRAISVMIWTTAVIIMAGGALALALGVSLPMRAEAIPVLLLTLGGLFGFGFIIGGATIVFKQVDALANFAQNILLFLNGALLPVDRLPAGVEAFSKTLPSTQGIIVIRKVVLDGQSLGAVWSDGSLPLLVANSAAYLVFGLLIFGLAERVARNKGTLGQY